MECDSAVMLKEGDLIYYCDEDAYAIVIEIVDKYQCKVFWLDWFRECSENVKMSESYELIL